MQKTKRKYAPKQNSQQSVSHDEGFNENLPRDKTAEQAIIRCLVDEIELIDDVSLTIQGPHEFYYDAYQCIYEHLLDMHKNNLKCDIVLLGKRLKNHYDDERVGGTSGLAELFEIEPIATHLMHYAKIVHENYLARELINITSTVAQEAALPGANVIEEIEKCAKKLSALESGRSLNTETASMKHISLMYVKEMRETERAIANGTYKQEYVPTGFIHLDDIIYGGFSPGQLITIAARPSMGKTALAMNIAQHMAVNDKNAIAFFSLEMSRYELVSRMLVAETGIPMKILRRHYYRKEEQDQLLKTLEKFSESPMFIYDDTRCTVADIAREARSLKKYNDLKAIFIDYLGLIVPESTEYIPRHESIGKTVRELKILAKELQIPVVCLAQLNRLAEGDPSPKLSTLRSSGDIEQDSDIVMFVHREDAGMTQTEAQECGVEGMAELILAKHRNGRIENIPVHWEREYARFSTYRDPNSLNQEF